MREYTKELSVHEAEIKEVKKKQNEIEERARRHDGEISRFMAGLATTTTALAAQAPSVRATQLRSRR